MIRMLILPKPLSRLNGRFFSYSFCATTPKTKKRPYKYLSGNLPKTPPHPRIAFRFRSKSLNKVAKTGVVFASLLLPMYYKLYFYPLFYLYSTKQSMLQVTELDLSHRERREVRNQKAFSKFPLLSSPGLSRSLSPDSPVVPPHL